MITIFVIFGWEIGVTEANGIIIGVGLSVDYIGINMVQYTVCKLNNRRNRMNQTYVKVGLSILSSCLVTLISTAFLLGCQIMVFKKFGIIIIATVLTSYLS